MGAFGTLGGNRTHNLLFRKESLLVHWATRVKTTIGAPTP